MSGITLGSLFDGISGFPLAGERVGITAKWASEIEPFPMRVSAIYFPGMEQKGDITKLNGAELEPVDIITGGSPCQDLSVAGKHAGLAGERSGLFVEQIRIVREMRNADNGKTNQFIRPRFMVWENVPELSVATKEKISAQSLKKQPGLQMKPLLFLDLRKGNGQLSAASWEMVGQLPGESWTLNTGESPKDAVESSLSQILEDNPHPKYFLSAKACQGILRRAEKRGKELPPMLKEALEKQAKATGEKELDV